MKCKLKSRVIIYGLAILAIVVGSPSVGAAKSCWWYYWGNLSYGQKSKWVGPFVAKETAMSEARGAKIMEPASNVYVFNRCTNKKYTIDGAPLGGSNRQERRPSSSYVAQLRSLYKTTTRLIQWAKQRHGRLSDHHVDVINRYVDTYNTRITYAKRSFPSTFGRWPTASRIDSSYKRTFYIYYRHKNSQNWTRINRGIKGEAATQQALNWFRRKYPDFYFAFK